MYLQQEQGEKPDTFLTGPVFRLVLAGNLINRRAQGDAVAEFAL